MRTMLRTLLLLCLLAPLGTAHAQQRFFFDDFEKWRDWTLTDEFEMDTCIGIGSTDPLNPYSGSRVLGVDLTGLGTNPGNYEPNLTRNQCLATSPIIDCRNYSGVHLKFQRWMNISGVGSDTARIEVSNDGGATWNLIWINGGTSITDVAWAAQDINISAYADGQPDVVVRFGIGGTNSSTNLGGWNIDNMEFTGVFTCNTPITNYWQDVIEAGGLANWYQSGLDDFDWTFTGSPTPTPNTGPDAGFSGTYFIYTNANGNLNNTASIISPCLNLSGMMNPAIEFYYHMYTGFTSDGMGNLYVDIERVAGSEQWITIWGKEGNHTNQWIKENIDLSPYKNQTFRLRFRAALIWSFYSDIALDYIKFFDDKCVKSPVAIQDAFACPGAPETLTLQQSTATYNWYNAPGGTLLATGSTYNTPGLSSNTTYYIQKTSSSSTDFLLTNYTADNTADGIMFDIRAKNALTIDSLDFILNEAAGTQVPIALLIKNKSFVGSETVSTGWSLHYADTIASAGPSTPVRIRFTGIQLNNQDTLACYLTVTNPSYGVRYTSYTAAYSDTNMVITRSTGKDYPFGANYTNKMFNGKIYYAPLSISTNFTGANTKSGFMIKLQAKKAIALEGLDVLLNNNSGTYTAYVYFKRGDHAGYENSAASWVLWDSVAVMGNASYISRINFKHELKIPSGELYSIYVGIPGTLIKNTTANMVYSNSAVDILSGTAVDYPFTGAFNMGRTLSCRLHYRLIDDATGIVPIRVMVPSIPIPTVSDTTICDGNIAILSGSSGPYYWWDADNEGNLLGIGNTYTTPVMAVPGIYHYYPKYLDTQITGNLTTSIAGGGNQQGTMFNITAGAEDVYLDSLSFLPENGGRYAMQIYYREGGYVGYETNPTAWHLFGNFFYPSVVANVLVNLKMEGLQIPAGTTYGFYITSQDKNIKYTSGSTPASNTYLTITPGIANEYPFGTTYTARTWNGRAYYSVGSTCYGIGDDVVLTVQNCSGIDEAGQDEKISVYPNPTSGLLNISTEGLAGLLQLEMFDITGMQVLSQQMEAGLSGSLATLDLRTLRAGTYVLNIRSESLNKVFKITVE